MKLSDCTTGEMFVEYNRLKSMRKLADKRKKQQDKLQRERDRELAELLVEKVYRQIEEAAEQGQKKFRLSRQDFPELYDSYFVAHHLRMLLKAQGIYMTEIPELPPSACYLKGRISDAKYFELAMNEGEYEVDFRRLIFIMISDPNVQSFLIVCVVILLVIAIAYAT